MEKESYPSDFDLAFSCRKGYPGKVDDNKLDPGYEAAKWAWDRQQQTINQLRQQQNDVRLALHRIGVG